MRNANTSPAASGWTASKPPSPNCGGCFPWRGGTACRCSTWCTFPTANIPGLEPWDGEAVVAKALPNAFAGTDLHARIQAAGRGEIVLAGFMTHMCVSTTARAALDHGYRTTIVAAAAATRDIPDPAGGVIPAAALHRTELAALADRFAVVVADSATLARAWA